MTTAKKDDVPTKTPAPSTNRQEPVISAAKNADAKTVTAAPVPPLVQAAATRKALDDALKAKIIEMLAQPGANMTRISEETGVSYGVIQGLRQKISPAPSSAARKVIPKVAAAEDVELMKLELEFLRRKVAWLESRR